MIRDSEEEQNQPKKGLFHKTRTNCQFFVIPGNGRLYIEKERKIMHIYHISKRVQNILVWTKPRLEYQPINDYEDKK